jgi:hypothetical protein
MTLDWQNALVLCVVLLAAVYVVRRLVQAARLKGGTCHACLGCPRRSGQGKKTEPPLVTIDPPKRTRS